MDYLNQTNLMRLWEISKHPLIVGVIIYFLGNHLGSKYFREKRAEKSLEIKNKIIELLVKAEEELRLFAIEHDKVVNTTKHFVQEKDKSIELEEAFKNGRREAFDKMSEILNDDLPNLVAQLVSCTDLYFYNSNKVDSLVKIWLDEVRRIHSFLVIKYPENIYEKTADSIPELNIKELQRIQANLVSTIIKEKTIWEND